MIMRTGLLLFFVCCSLLMGCRTARREDHSSGVRMIGGAVAEQGQFPATVRIQWGAGETCTATVIARRALLTAAHCVVMSDPPITEGLNIEIGQGTTPDNIRIHNRVVKTIHVAPGYSARVESSGGEHPYWDKNAPDAAVLIVDRDLPIRRTSVDFAPIHQGDTIVALGFGCESDEPYIRNVAERRSLKFAQMPVSKLLAGYFNIRPGDSDEKRIKLCAGDSGGGVYRKDLKAIVGINSFTSFSNDFSWMQRLDIATVENWLRPFVQP